MVICFRSSEAFRSISIGETYRIAAGMDVPVMIVNDDNDSQAINYTVGLYTTAGNSLICTHVTSTLAQPTMLI